ncbi:uncharacterized protein DUF1439 [Paucimonas lemoignei]|uniref:Uncharacterized protein DUF1439 n=1 Tax=Paucimonas lemoignei TaxID=29443 RepID=A0A4R3HUU7_PAULE|nr:DUF1439 domain-containing protein [Paucimonas lemoignei]TCS36838.1 uncharacterized protein DUF1439 [Paucimonas lemoignei]
MTRLFFRFSTILLALFLTACAGMLGPRDVDVPLSKLQASLEKRFPFNSRYLELFDIQLSSPRLSLQPNGNRVVTSFDASIAPAWLKRSWQGNFALSGVLAVDPAKNAVVLTDPRVESLNINGLDDKYARQLTKVSSLLTEEVFRNMPLYTFQPEDFRYGGTSFFPTKINTQSNGLVVTFEPVK